MFLLSDKYNWNAYIFLQKITLMFYVLYSQPLDLAWRKYVNAEYSVFDIYWGYISGYLKKKKSKFFEEERSTQHLQILWVWYEYGSLRGINEQQI